MALLLRASQAVYYTRVTGVKPVFLMDDVMLELDPDKRQKMTAISSPLARGLLYGDCGVIIVAGIIPARAGFTRPAVA